MSVAELTCAPAVYMCPLIRIVCGVEALVVANILRIEAGAACVPLVAHLQRWIVMDELAAGEITARPDCGRLQPFCVAVEKSAVHSALVAVGIAEHEPGRSG